MLPMISEIPPDVGIQKHLTAIHIEEWVKNDFLQPKWWILIALVLLAVFLWWNMLYKPRMPEICLYAVLAAIMTMAIVEYGEELTLWDYPIDIIPIFPPLTSINLISLPLVYSLVYQRFTTRKSFLLASAAATAAMCFVLEPILVWAGFYKLLHWEYYLSFPIYFLMAILVRALVVRISTISKRPGEKV